VAKPRIVFVLGGHALALLAQNHNWNLMMERNGMNDSERQTRISNRQTLKFRAIKEGDVLES
jgi:hypothetical protein